MDWGLWVLLYRNLFLEMLMEENTDSRGTTKRFKNIELQASVSLILFVVCFNKAIRKLIISFMAAYLSSLLLKYWEINASP